MTTLPLPSFQPALRKGRGIVLALGLACMGASAASAAPIVANFTDGNSSSQVDAYTGVAGDGWATAWGTARNTENSSQTITVTDSNPFPDGGNRLSVSLTSTHSAARGLTVARRYDGVNLAKAQTISFDFRLDSTPAETRRFYFFDSTLSDPTLSGEAATNTWSIRVNANGRVLLGNGRSGANAVFYTVPSGDITLSAGTPYRFTIEVSPAAVAAESSYTVRIENLTNPVDVYQSAALAFIGSHTATGGNLNFYSSLEAVSSSTTLTYSLDNISVVPETSTVALASAGLVSLGLARLLRPRRVEVAR